ncbi:MAG: FHA domain-containing protein [Planctomycetes bacterium]|nr:FHA domain-containing protein [Planctomycetota bacterium]
MPRLVYVDKIIDIAGEAVLGRQRENALYVDDGAASRRHARVFTEAGGWWVEDLESANGTQLNGQKLIERRKLSHDDVIGIGKSRILFQDETAQPEPLRARRSKAEVGALANPDTLIGRTLGGYRLEAVIGKSTLGVMFRARDAAKDRAAALKVFSPQQVNAQEGFGDRLRAAMERALAAADESLVVAHACGTDAELGLAWYAAEYVEGDTLKALVKRDGRLAPALGLLLIERAAQALRLAHARGIVHRDLHPGNVMLTAAGKIRVLEVGLAEVLQSGRSAPVAGDPAYLSPEQLQPGAIDKRCDIYALGCILHLLLTGKPPYDGDDAATLAKAHRTQAVPSLRAVLPQLPARADDLLNGMMNKNPAWRYGSIDEVLADLRPLREQVDEQTSAPPATDRPATVPRTEQARAERISERSAPRKPTTQQRASRALLILAGLVVAGLAGNWALKQPSVRDLLHGRGPQHPPPDAAPGPLAVVPATPVTSQAKTPEPADKKPTAPTDQAAQERWDELEVSTARDRAQGDWGAAEQSLATFIAHGANGGILIERARIAAGKLRVEGDAWYRSEIAKLPPLDRPENLGRALAALSRLRDTALASDRSDAESRYQEVQTRLVQQLEAARRDARLRLEGGKADELPALAAKLAPVFAGTPIAGLHRQFAAAAAEAARSAAQWQGTWATTRTALTAATGEPALAAGAALILAGDATAGKLLLRDQALASGPLLKRREAVLGREAAVLTFRDVSDLQYIETTIGDLQFADGALTGPRGEAVGLACTVPLGGDDWEAALSVRFSAAAPDAELVISCVHQETQELLLRIDSADTVIRVHGGDGWQEAHPSAPSTDPLALRLSCRGGKLRVLINGQPELDIESCRVPAGSHLHLDVSGGQWRLEELQVVGGE